MKFVTRINSLKKIDKDNYSYYILKTQDDKIGICCFAPNDEQLSAKLESIWSSDCEVLEQYEFTIRYGAYKAKNGSFGRCFRIIDIS
ncbi:MAG: hypothetical protein NC122_00645 [Faecalibacterium sp.]|nr:hypothetical protein [Muribaculaceae bacterium]MCM1363597.1 hypothetical protein [Ruminococcus sp.]MCM1484696.1 hypothetical protein [Faecalibacterium sp.]